ncbi:hypothetical protein KC340_g12894 [Hortaea werneckii]|nr:hypothetical protein KC342_g13206 [Hortaea werneckii]KAI7097362.1 hypothetical protein KC339_g9753 [Hortaea werneckii]KAI7238250.1 hypothetical protein KC365_g4497 [Hortaea werneckii]KAI7301957.1 hypothetical protein KC340_g12894 [Hortaea werneckii]KAI7369090.1 hypothetical protein KC354_g2182 [Hortaea werneckii]
MAPYKPNRTRKNRHRSVYPSGPPGRSNSSPPGQQTNINQDPEPNMAQHVSQEEYDELLDANDELKRNSREMNRFIGDLQRKEDSSQNMIWKLSDEKRDLEQQIMRMHELIHGHQQVFQQERRARMASEAQTADLQRQLLAFKRDIAVSAKKEDQLTDDEIRQKMNQIYYSIQDFAVGILRSRNFDFMKLSQEGKSWFQKNGFRLKNVKRSGYVQLLISLITKIVIDLYDPDYLFGLPRKNTALYAVAETVARINDTNVIGFKEWLQSTRKLMQHHNKHATHEADEDLFVESCSDLQDLFEDAIVIDWQTETPRLVKILAPALDLFRKLHSAKADFKVKVMPVQHRNGIVTFDTDTMTAIQSEEEEDELLGRALQISVFPAVYKYGNEVGQNMEEMTTVCKAKVVVQKPKVAAKEDMRIKLEE